ncbi:helix-turn-helix transcriptional regulator [Adlercreutzia sp. ZJ304]|nr:helix-turn-helix transcriptional regulator [Adlercreutzia sp. ZJ304]
MAACIVTWSIAGVSQAALLMWWSIYLSLVTTRYTPIVIAIASCLGTCLYIVVATISLPLIGVIMIALLEVISFLILMALMKMLPKDRVNESENYETVDYITTQGAIAVGTYGLVFGYTTTTLFSLGAEATVIGCSTGIIGSLMPFALYKFNRNIDIDISTIQRLTLPPVVIGILFLPFGDDLWRLFFCCLVNIALSHFSVISLSNAMTLNSEFSIKPLKRSSVMQIPVWIGIFIGSLLSAFIWLFSDLSFVDLMFVSIVIASLIVCAIAIYGLDDSVSKKQFYDLLTHRNKEEILAKEDSRTNEIFDAKFAGLTSAAKLSPREIEVFRLLAKGRNAEYISKKLVISGATAKSHIYHIYQKMGINSQQSLIDRLEEYSNKETLKKANALYDKNSKATS